MFFGDRTKFDFKNLFTFEMANNHQGSVSHGKKIIDAMAEIAKEFNLKAAVKLQFRDLDTFIHPKFKDRDDVKHIPRFQSTRLSREQFKELVEYTKSKGLITMATPFDERSVDFLESLDIDIVKVASCSSQDWPLLKRISETRKPIIASVGGLRMNEIDKVVSFFTHRGSSFAIMHCVAVYPTPSNEMFLKQIKHMIERYPGVTIGFSTHEAPEDTQIVGLAYVAGARIYEKHVGVPTDEITLNKYSSNPLQTREWVRSLLNAKEAYGEANEREVTEKELADLQSLKRGVFALNDIKRGQTISREDVFFAMPMIDEDHINSGEFVEGMVADQNYRSGEPVSKAAKPNGRSKKEIIYGTIHKAKAMLNLARVPLSHDFTVEISHHYGLEKFDEIGCIIIDCFNREYARKLIIQLPGQFHPTHYHKIKDETFHILSGSMEVNLEGKKRMLYPGDSLWVPRGVWHSFKTERGVIFEEISTTSMETSGDSFYTDKKIAGMSREERKTKLQNWGRHQFDDED